MILPIGDSPNPEGTPLVTSALIAANVAIYVLMLPLAWARPDASDPLLNQYLHLIAQQSSYKLTPQEILASISAYDLTIFRWGYRPASPSVVDLFTSMFLHGGFTHIFGNMLFLWIYGDNVEHRLGHARFLAYYLATGAAATLFHAMFAPTSPLPLVGASGAISGVLGFYFLWFPRNRVHLLLLFPFLVRMAVSARVLLGLYIVVQNVFPFLLSRGVGGVAHGAHIGGFLAGLAIAYGLNRRELADRPPEYAAAASGRGEGAGEGIRKAIAAGNMARAAEDYFQLSPPESRRLLTAGDSIRLGKWLSDNGHPKAALVVYRRHLRDYPNGPGVADAHAGAGLLQMRHFDQDTAAYQHFLDALDQNPSPATESLARQGLRTIAERQKPLRPLLS